MRVLHVVVAKEVNALAAALLADVERDGAGLSATAQLFRGVTVLVPSREAENVVLRALARAQGGTMNVTCLSLDRYLHLCAESLSEPATLLDRPVLEREILRYLLARSEAELPEPVVRYLKAAGNADAPVARRTITLARRLAETFELFLSDAPITTESNSHAALPMPLAGPDWLRALYAEIVTAQAVRDTVSPRRVSLHALAQALAHPSTSKHPADGPTQALYAYCLPPLSRAQRAAIVALSRSRTLRFYTQIPGDPGRTQNDLARLILDEWAAPARASLCDLVTEAGATEAILPESSDTIREDEGSPSPRADAPLHARLTVLACPTPRREIEAIAARIWEHVRASHGAACKLSAGTADRTAKPPLRFSDIGILVPPTWAEAAHTLLASVLDEAGLPYRIVGAKLARSSPVVDAVTELIRLPGSDYTREQVLRVLTSDAILTGQGQGDATAWIALCERLGIVRGCTARDLEGTYLADDRVSWEHGLARLALGFFSAAAPDAPAPILETGTRPFLPANLGIGAQQSALRFAQVAQTLLDAGQALRGARLPISTWIARFTQLIESLVVPDDWRDENALYACLAQLRALDDPNWTEPLSYAVASELMAFAIEHLTSTVAAEGEHEGILIAPLAAARGRSFRVLFLCGMGLGQFPAPEARHELDLRTPSSIPTCRERALDRTFFAEALFNTVDAVYLSYQARDPTTGDSIEPSVLVRESELALGAVCRHERVPLERDADETATRNLDMARREAYARALAEHLAPIRAAVHTTAQFRTVVTQVTSQPLTPILGPVFADPGFSRSTAAERLPLVADTGKPRARLRLHAIRRFLECPMQGAARIQLRLQDSESPEESEAARLMVSDEPLDFDRLQTMQLLTRAFESALATAVGSKKTQLPEATLQAAYDALYTRLVLSGAAAAGAIGNNVRARHLEILVAWAAALNAIWPELASPPRIVSWGGATSDRPIDACFAPIILPRSPLTEPNGAKAPETSRPDLAGTVELGHESGIALDFHDGRRGTFIPTLARHAQRGLLPDQMFKRGLYGFMDHLAWSAATDAARPFFIAFGSSGTPKPFSLSLAPILRADALRYLRSLLDTIIFERHAYLLPCEALFTCFMTKKHPPLDLEIRRMLDLGISFSSRWGPVVDIASLPVPDDEAAVQMFRSRFGLYVHTAAKLTVETD